MTEERTTPLRQRMIEDVRIRGMGDKAQKAHIRAIKDFAAFLGRSPDTATPEDLRAQGDETLHAVPHPATEAAGRVQRRGGLRHPDGGTRARPEVSRGAQHLIRRRAAGRRGLQPQRHSPSKQAFIFDAAAQVQSKSVIGRPQSARPSGHSKTTRIMMFTFSTNV